MLGWDRPVTSLVTEFLLRDVSRCPPDLRDTLVVVPTRQAGRRLREALAAACAQYGALLAPRVVTPNFFWRDDSRSAAVAPPMAVMLAWVQVLRVIERDAFPAFFPKGSDRDDVSWVLRTARMLSGVREELAEGAYTIQRVCQRWGNELQEAERWQDLARLEQIYLRVLEAGGFADPCRIRLRCAESPLQPEGIRRMVVAAVPDPSHLFLQALEQLAELVPVAVLVHAPDEEADHFDRWGRPDPAWWTQVALSLPDYGGALQLAARPIDQARCVLSHLSRMTPTLHSEVAVGVPDSSVAPFVESLLEEHGVACYNPAGTPMRCHVLYRLLELGADLLEEGAYDAVRGFLRQADVLDMLRERCDIPADRLLTQLDEFQNRHLPLILEDMRALLARNEGRYDLLSVACDELSELVQGLRSAGFPDALRLLLEYVFEYRDVTPGRPDDGVFLEGARILNEMLEQWRSAGALGAGFSVADGFRMVLNQLQAQFVYPERNDARIDLEGWLELPWSAADTVVVTGMNEGAVPDGSISDVLLPDSLRRQLDLRHDALRHARDAFLLSALVASRPGEGQLGFMVGKTNARGDPLKPSRLLFQCEQEQLVTRCRQLFGEARDHRAAAPFSVTFPLDAASAGNVTVPATLSVTALRDYLACPFRFYLSRMLRMEALRDDKTELDAMDYGNLVHEALCAMAASADMRSCDDPYVLGAWLQKQVDEWLAARFARLPVQVMIQRDSACERLQAAAHVQAALVRDGWETVAWEEPLDMLVGDVRIVGKIDRIDRHPGQNRWRILDYKTSDTPQQPDKVHLQAPRSDQPDYQAVSVGGKTRAWYDLQLPLYASMLQAREGAVALEVGYFNLPRATSETGVCCWEDWSEELMASGLCCARGIMEDLRAGRFWPPSDNVKYDAFEWLFYGRSPAEVFEPLDPGEVAP
jgi:ATP-dependent helicase/nuclease subunit B